MRTSHPAREAASAAAMPPIPPPAINTCFFIRALSYLLPGKAQQRLDAHQGLGRRWTHYPAQPCNNWRSTKGRMPPAR
jgi:hypothetical protein